MITTKTYFEQVPLAVVKRIVEEQDGQRKTDVLSHGETPTMSEKKLEYPEWQKPLQDLILEFDRDRLFEKVKKVEAMIIERDRQLAAAPDGHAERVALSDAMLIIRVLTERRAH